MGKKHSELGGSGAESWLNCPGGVRLRRKFPKQEDSEYSLEGTRAHHFVFQYASNFQPLIMNQIWSSEFYQEMVPYARIWLEEIRNTWSAHRGQKYETFFERKFNMSKILGVEDQSGTTDGGVAVFGDTLYVKDYKHGAGIYVDVEENEQLIYYALGALEYYNWNFKRVVLTIVQPRITGYDAVRSWEAPISYFREQRKRFYEGAQRTQRKDAEFKQGSWCRFCTAKLGCPAIKKMYNDKDAFDVIKTKNLPTIIGEPKKLSADKLGQMYAQVKPLRAFLDAIEDEVKRVLLKGGKVTGFKTVHGRGSRVWINAEKAATEAQKQFGDRAFTKRELLTPAQLEKVVDSTWVKQRISKIAGAPTIVPESDKRPDINSQEREAFEVIERGGKLGKEKGRKENDKEKSRKKESNKKGKKVKRTWF